MSASLLGGNQFYLAEAYSVSQNRAMTYEFQQALKYAIEEIEFLNPVSDIR